MRETGGGAGGTLRLGSSARTPRTHRPRRSRSRSATCPWTCRTRSSARRSSRPITFIHELLDGDAGEGSAGGLTVTASTQVIVDGRTVSLDDPRAREAMNKAAAKLRAQGLDELAADLEARAAAPPPRLLPPRPVPLLRGRRPAPGEDDQSLPAAAADDEPRRGSERAGRARAADATLLRFRHRPPGRRRSRRVPNG